ncbi:MAG: nucleoside-diphosphate kinase [Pseudomonadota bacterium]
MSDLHKFGIADEVREQALRVLTINDLEDAKNVALVLLKPDAFATGKVTKIVGYLEKYGIQTIYYSFLQSPELRQFEELYKFNISESNEKNQLGSWWINCRTYLQGPSLLLLVRPNESTTDVYALLNKMKGASAPLRGKPGSLRYDLNGSTRSINLIHISDDVLSSIREFCIFRPLEAFKNAIRINLPNVDSLDVNGEIVAVAQSCSGELYDLDFFRCHWRVLLRAVFLFSDTMKVPAFLKSNEHISHDLNDISDLFERGSEYAKNLSSVDLNGLGIDRQHNILLEKFLNLRIVEESHVSELIGQMRFHKCKVGDWEEIVLVSGTHYRDDLDLLFSGTGRIAARSKCSEGGHPD